MESGENFGNQQKLNDEKEKIENIYRDFCDFVTKDSEKHERLFKEKIDFEKFAIELELKNIELILDILKFVISISISVLIALLTTNLFNQAQLEISIGINIILIIALVILLKKRDDIIKIDLRTLIDYRNKISKQLADYDSVMWDYFRNYFREKLSAMKRK